VKTRFRAGLQTTHRPPNPISTIAIDPNTFRSGYINRRIFGQIPRDTDRRWPFWPTSGKPKTGIYSANLSRATIYDRTSCGPDRQVPEQADTTKIGVHYYRFIVEYDSRFRITRTRDKRLIKTDDVTRKANFFEKNTPPLPAADA